MAEMVGCKMDLVNASAKHRRFGDDSGIEKQDVQTAMFGFLFTPCATEFDDGRLTLIQMVATDKGCAQILATKLCASDSFHPVK